MFRIVVIEDDPIMRKMLHKTLTPEGYECIMAPNAGLGIKFCQDNKPDLILLDVHLPDDNGIEVCKKLKADPGLRHIPILIMTGEASAVDKRIEGLEAGADDYILKPLSPKELISRLRGIIRAATKPTL